MGRVGKAWSEITVQASVNNGQGFVDNLIYDEQIAIRALRNTENGIIFKTTPGEYRKAAFAARRFGGKTKIIRRQGIYFTLRQYRNRFGIIFGSLSFAFVIVFLSNFVLDIEISGNTSLTQNQILEHLANEGIKTGKKSEEINKTRAEVSLLLGLDKLAWTSVELVGSRLYVKVTERGEGEESISKDLPCNIVANKTGRIIETEIYRGRLERPIGSGVARGELIVSGAIDNGNGEIIYSHAEAKIIAECEEFVSFYSPYISAEKKRNGKVLRKDFMEFLGQSYPLFIDLSYPENSVYHEEIRQPDIFGFKLPLRIKSAVYTEYNNVEVCFLNEEVISRLNTQIENYKSNFYGNTEIIRWDTEYIPEESGIRANISITYRIDIAEKSEIFVH